MKLIGKHINRDKSSTTAKPTGYICAVKGHVSLRPEEDEDMWHIYNLLQEGDKCRATAVRRVSSETATGSVESHRIRITLTLDVTRVIFSPGTSSASSSANGVVSTTSTATTTGATLNITGRNVTENEYIRLGAFHTLDLEPNRDVKIIKDEWDSVALSRVEEACAEGRGAEVGAIVCGEGTAAFCLVTQHMTVIRQRIDVPVPRKRAGSTTLHDKGVARFYITLYTAFLRHIPFSSLRVVVIASPGFTKDAVYDYIFAEAIRTNNKALIQAKNKFVRVHVTSPHVHSLVEVLKSPEITSQLKDTKFAREGIMLDKFFRMLGSDEMRAWYGPEHVALAADRGAIGTLLISDDLFRASDPVHRRKYVNLVESAKAKGAETLIFSSMHESGQQLNQLTGIAAILTFPLDVEVVEAEEREAKEEAEAAKAALAEAQGNGEGT